MSKILVIDSNPEQMRSLSGLISYRTPHTMIGAESSVSAVRAVVSQKPDLIMINALMYMQQSFSFHRAMQKNPRAAAIPILIHTSSPLEDLTRRRMEVNGVASIIDLPASGGELAAYIERATIPPAPQAQAGEVSTVSWTRVEHPKQQGSAPSGGPAVKPVDWTSVSASRKGSAEPPPAQRVPPRSTASSASAIPRASQNGSEDAASKGFRPQTFRRVDDDEKVKGGESFQTSAYPRVNPRDVKNRPGK